MESGERRVDPSRFGRKGEAAPDVMTRLRALQDEILNPLLDNVEAIRSAQVTGNGTPDDTERLKQLEMHINARLKELGEEPISLS